MKHSVTAFLVFSLIALAGCTDSPSDVLAAIEQAAERGDATAFGSHFTIESRPFAETLVRVQKAARHGQASPIEKFSTSNRINSEKIKGNFAVVTAEYADGTTAKIIFRRENGQWRLDPAATESGVVPDGRIGR